MPLRSGAMRISFDRNSLMERCTFCSVRIRSICCATPMALPNSFSGANGVPTFTAITTSAPIARAISTGRLRTSPPSTTRRFLTRIGANTPGIASDARNDRNSGVSRSSTSSPDTRSEATELNGNASWFTGRSRMSGGRRLSNAASSAAFPAAAGGRDTPAVVTANSMREGS